MLDHLRGVGSGREGGFTLIELLVAVTILSVGILSVGQILVISSQNASFGRTETLAVSLAREIQEKILSESVDQMVEMFDNVDTALPGSITAPCEVWAGHLVEQLGPNGRGTIQVFDPAEDPELLDGMYGVFVEIQWVTKGENLSFPLRFAVTSISS